MARNFVRINGKKIIKNRECSREQRKLHHAMEVYAVLILVFEKVLDSFLSFFRFSFVWFSIKTIFFCLARNEKKRKCCNEHINMVCLKWSGNKYHMQIHLRAMAYMCKHWRCLMSFSIGNFFDFMSGGIIFSFVVVDECNHRLWIHFVSNYSFDCI